MIIAIDGPAGSGKSTISKKVANKLKFSYLDTGAMYRALTFDIMTKNISFDDIPAVLACTHASTISFKGVDTETQKVFLNGKDVSREIRTPEVTNNVKFVAKIPDVRKHLVAQQRLIAEGNNVVLEGRDTTTVVFPDADFKIFLDADQKERAQRRFIELQEKGIAVTFDEILADQKKRDESDYTREVGPLAIAPGAYVIDTSGLSIEDVVWKIIRYVKGKPREKKLFFGFCKYMCYLFSKVYLHTKAIGLENIPAAGPFIIACNHASHLDPAIAGSQPTRHIQFFARDTLFQIPFLGWLLPRINAHQIKRGEGDLKALRKAEELLKSDYGVFLFPEGTRSPDGSIQNAKSGIGFIACRSGAPVIPTYIHNTNKALSKGAKFVKSVPVTVYYGKPLYFSLPRAHSDKKPRDIYEEATRMIMDSIRQLQKEALQ
jgi:cytidylate kinase